MPSAPLTLTTADGQMDGVIAKPEGSGPWAAIILYMDAMGVRPDLISMAERLADHGYVVILPNLFYRSGPQPPVDKVAFAQPGPERERVFALIQSIDHAKVLSDTKSILTFLDGEADVRGPYATLGYCQGGGYALSASATFPDRIAATASFHGGWLATDRPDSPHLLAPKMRAELYIGVAGIDPLFSAEECDRLKDALTRAGCRFTLEVYEGVRHGFSVTGHPVYDRAASERHWTVIGDLFERTLGRD